MGTGFERLANGFFFVNASRTIVGLAYSYSYWKQGAVAMKALDKLQRVMNAAARVVSDTHKFDRGLTSIRRNDPHWLDVPEHVTFGLCVMVYKCLHDMAPPYLSELCRQTGNIEGRRQLRSATRGDLDLPRCRPSTIHTADGPSPALAQQHESWVMCFLHQPGCCV